MREDPERVQDMLDAIAAIERYIQQDRQAFEESGDRLSTWNR
ncbi:MULTISPECIES: hypothetical protein [unclassified Roseofilum]|nr:MULTISPECIES: hypothetical protein [unclassified Roseofilum]